ncbi:hypothetical protein [Nocardiopsis trehalosi]|uniref:hypothetical protein n=1 Tax=Nocardiopsis trehalosi TaxID=109329 RepID=UPI00082AA993|nr:hypothetical protein [Nocardiopsis trehalosi]
MGTLSWLNGSAPTSPADAVRRLHGHLAATGAQRMYAGERSSVALLSVRAGLTVWCMRGAFHWRDEQGEARTHPAADPEGAARRLTGAHHTGRERTAA